MAVTIPSDLILDVMHGASPERLKVARHNLTEIAPDGVPLFQDAFRDIVVGEVANSSDSDNVNSSEQFSPRHGSPQVTFEQMFLRNMFEAMMPSAESGIYGDEVAASGVWRSMAAEQFAITYSEQGGLGIAKSMTPNEPGSGPVSRAQWPYFETSSISTFSS